MVCEMQVINYFLSGKLDLDISSNIHQKIYDNLTIVRKAGVL